MIQGVAAKWSFSALSAINIDNQCFIRDMPNFTPLKSKIGYLVFLILCFVITNHGLT